MKFKAIVFDYGGVLVVNNLGSKGNLMDNIGKVLGVSGDEFRKEYFKHNHISNVEGRPWIEAALSAARFFNDSPEAEAKIRQINDDFNNAKALNHELLETVDDLKKSGYTIAILSNYTSELRRVLQEQGISNYFDHIFVSGEMGCQKPDPKAFEMVCADLEIAPDEMVFIDDTQKSLESAPEVGYVPILYQNNIQLYAELRNLGVLPKV